MHSIWYSLAWKEWHEHKWKLVSILAILWAVIVYTVLASRQEVDVLQLAMAAVICCMIPLSIFVALGDAAGERSRNTLAFMQALPVSNRKLAIAKLVLGLATLIVPLVLACLLIYGWSLVSESLGAMLARSIEQALRHRTRIGIGNPIVDYLLIAATVSASLYLWSAAVGVNRKDEVSAAAVAMAVIVGTWVIFAFLASAISPETSSSPVGQSLIVLLAALPGAALGVEEIGRRNNPASWLYIAIGLAAHAALAGVYIRRFGRIANREITSPRGEQTNAYLLTTILPPRRSPSSAIFWKQSRESAPLVAVGLFTTVAATVVLVLADLRSYLNRPGDINLLFMAASAWVGTLLAMVIGIGAFLYDTEPGLMTFWRSRPINLNLWFWTKVFTALFILLAAVYTPTLIALAASGTAGDELRREPEMWIIPAGHLATFAAAVAMTCLVRHAVYAAILSIPAAFAGPALAAGALMTAAGSGWLGPDFAEGRDPPGLATAYAAGLLLSFCGNIALAWLAVRFDWGRKSRY